MDKTIINLFSILVGGAGLFVVLTKFYTPELNMTFLGSNPFHIKRHIIDNVMTLIFTYLALAGLTIKVLSEIFASDLPDRIYTSASYFIVLISGIIIMWVVVLMLINVGEAISKKSWLPKITESQQELFQSSLFIVENDGWRKDQLAIKDSLKNTDKYKEKNLETAREDFEQIEKLLELPPTSEDLKGRAERLKPYFQ